MIILKKNKNDVRENHRDNYFEVFSNSSQHDVLKHNFINFFIFVQKKELTYKINNRI